MVVVYTDNSCIVRINLSDIFWAFPLIYCNAFFFILIAPQLDLKYNRTDEGFLIFTCNASDMCIDAQLTLFITDGDSTKPLLSEDGHESCNSATKMKTINLTASTDVYVNNISCKPLTLDEHLAENLTKTLLVCGDPSKYHILKSLT